MITELERVLQKNKDNFHAVIDFDAEKDRIVKLDFTEANKELTIETITDTKRFSDYINNKLSGANAKYGIGGYNEDRALYKRSKHFAGEEPRTIHLEMDIWANAGTKVYVPIGGTVHSFAYNNTFGDYGATIILEHQLDTIVFYTLYGHLSVSDLAALQEGKYISRGELLGHFGTTIENGDWPPHLHFQIIQDMRIKKGDYPGVCTIAEREKYLHNCPDPDLILNIMGKLKPTG